MAHQLDKSILERVNEHAEALERELNADVVTFFGPIVPNIYREFRDFFEHLARRKEGEVESEKRLAVVLRTLGGSAETTERFVQVIRRFYPNEVAFIVPDMAMSAGTIFCMSGDRILMDYSSSLGPIDPQIPAKDGEGYVPALGHLQKVEEVLNKEELLPADVLLLKLTDLGYLAMLEEARELSIDLLKTWLVRYKFKDWDNHRTTNAGTAVTTGQKEQRAKEIAEALSDHKRWHSHGRCLDIEKLRELRLEIDDYSDKSGLAAAIRNYNDILTIYCDRMQFVWVMHNRHLELVGY